MKFGLFYEHQLPQPAGGTWDDDAERRRYQDALDQVELADRASIPTADPLTQEAAARS